MQSVKEVSETTEEYLEAVYRLQEKSGRARTGDLVRLLNVVPGSVTNTIERLEREGYVTHEPYKGVKLTDKGRRVALQVVRRHRLCERLLTDILHVEWYAVHEAACRLEHVFTKELVKKIEKALGHPRTCPHGNPIPTGCGGVFAEDTEPLITLKKGESARVAQITDEGHQVLRRLASSGIVPGATIKVLRGISIKKLLLVKVGETNCELTRSLASAIRVRRGR
ncbi:MAG: metal-dependent transcriptional regulator [Candidatus Bathyarchaeia archaeon]